MATDLLEETVRQVSYVDMYMYTLEYLKAWVDTSKVKIGLKLYHKLFTWVRYILCESDNFDNEQAKINTEFYHNK